MVLKWGEKEESLSLASSTLKGITKIVEAMVISVTAKVEAGVVAGEASATNKSTLNYWCWWWYQGCKWWWG